MSITPMDADGNYGPSFTASLDPLPGRRLGMSAPWSGQSAAGLAWPSFVLGDTAAVAPPS